MQIIVTIIGCRMQRRLVFKLLRPVDGGQPVMGKVYHEFFQVQEHFEGLTGMPTERKKQVVDLWGKRWEQAFSPMQAAGYALDPEYRMHEFASEVREVVLKAGQACYTHRGLHTARCFAFQLQVSSA